MLELFIFVVRCSLRVLCLVDGLLCVCGLLASFACCVDLPLDDLGNCGWRCVVSCVFYVFLGFLWFAVFDLLVACSIGWF